MTVVTAHAPGYLPGVSVIRKVAAADVVIWLDEVRYTTPGWMDRNRLPDDTWLTVPVRREDHRSQLRHVEIMGDAWVETHAAALTRAYSSAPCWRGGSPVLDVLQGPVDWSGHPLVELTISLLDAILQELDVATHQVQQSDHRAGGRTISTRLARTIRQFDGDVYLATPPALKYLDKPIFDREGIAIELHTHTGPNPSIVDPLYRAGRLDPTPAAVAS